MAGEDLSSLAFAFARFIQRESHRRRFPRTQNHHAARRRHGLGVTSGPRRRFFAGNNRQNRRRGDARHGNHPVHQAGPSAPAAANGNGPATPPTAFFIPPMEWLVAGPSAPFLGEEEMLPCLGPQPLPPYCLQHHPCPACTGAPPRLPSPTPSDELPEHFFLQGYGPIPEPPSPTPAAEELHGNSTVPDLNMEVNVGEEEMEGQGSSSTPPAPPLPPTPPSEARRILRQFAGAMAQNRVTLRGAWSPAALGLASAPGESSSGWNQAARGAPERVDDRHGEGRGEQAWRGERNQIE